MDLANIFELWDRFDTSRADEIELDMPGIHFRLKHTGTVSGQHQTLPKQQGEPEPAEKEVEPAGDMEKSAGTEVKAPLIGRFYLAPSPDADPFVKPGQSVKKGQVVGIIEAMKLMNEITAPADGVVTEILATDGTLVEYEQTLMTII